MESTKEQEIEEEYLSSLTDLNVNSKPLINMLTMLAEENIEHAPVIVKAVEKHLAKSSSDVKLPILYLIDSIVKNVGKQYKSLFSQNIVNIFCGVFEKVNEKVREKMFNLRMTWNEVFPLTKLYALDVKVKGMDGNWPITAELGKVQPSIHVNPNFIKNKVTPKTTAPSPPTGNEEIQKQVEEKERELLILQKRKIELEVIQYRKKIEEQERDLNCGAPLMNSRVQHSLKMGIQAPVQSMVHMMNGPMGQNRVRIAPVNPGLVNSARLRDPRLANRMRQPQAQQIQQNPTVPQPLMSISTGLTGVTPKFLPRIPKFAKATSSQSNESRDRDDRDPRSSSSSRRRDDKSSLKSSSSSSSSSSKDSKRSDNRSKVHSNQDRKKSISSDESPRKKGDEDKKPTKSRIAHTKNSPSKSGSSSGGGESKDVDLRVVPGSGRETTKSTNDKLLKKLLLEDSKDNRSTDNNVFFTESAAKQDIDLRFTETGCKKRSLTGGEDMEPTMKKNKSERVDLLFGNEDVDLRTLGVDSDSSGTLASVVSDKKSASKAKDANFQALRAKLMVASTKMDQEKTKARAKTDVKLLENGATDVTKMINMNIRKEKLKLDAKEHQDDSNSDSNHSMPKRQRFIPEENNKNEIPVDFGMMTAAELRNDGLSTGALDRSKKRKESKWNPVNPVNHNQQVPQNQQPFASPWENLNPHVGGNISDVTTMLTKLKNDASIPLVMPQSSAQPILNNKMRTVRLDGTKDHLLRFYNETAIIFNESGEPHDIKFSGGQSHVIIDEVFTVVLSFNNDYNTIVVNGKMHRIKFGKPTRELYIDDQFYECYFNNMTTKIMLDGSLRIVRIDGKVPEVKIGRKRCDLVLGRINMVIDAEVIVPVFLDTTLQYFEFKGIVYTLQFADFFLSVVLNNDAYRVEFGGLPKNFKLNGEKHFLRFTALPDHIEAGNVNLRGMRRTHLFRDRKSPPLVDEYLEEAPPIVNDVDISKLVDADIQLQKNDFSSLLAAATTPSQSSVTIPGIGNDVELPPAQETPAPNLNINELLQKLVATGILTGNNSSLPVIPQISSRDNNGNRRDSREDETKRMSSKLMEQKKRIDPVSLSRPETIKKRQLAIVELLYIGIQCSSCGLRFPPEQTMKYSQHLDWHFRQNRRERDSQRRAHSRKWYYNCSDWIKYEEIEDLEEREKNFFETQMEAMDQNDDSNQGRGASGNQENAVTTSCAAGPDDLNRCCEVCHDTFEQFFNEETEEWHLRAAIKMDDKFYHPICYEDYKSSLTMDESALQETTEVSTKEYDDDDDDDILEMKDVIVKEEKPDISELKKEEKSDVHNGDNNNEDEDDDVIVMPTQEPIITEVLDDTDVAIDVQPEPIDNRLNMTDDDVMINEPKIETQNLVDDEDSDNSDDEDFVSKKTNESPDVTLLPIIVKIKEEPKDDGYEDEQNEEDNFVEVTTIANDDFIHDEAYSNSPKTAFVPDEEENAVFDDTSLQMEVPLTVDDTEDNSRVQQDELMDADEGSRPETNPLPIVGGTKKLKIVLSSLAQNNLTNKNSNANSNSNVIDTNDTSNNLESLNKLDDNGVNSLEAQNESSMDQQQQQAGVNSTTLQDEDIEFEVKPQLQGIKFDKQLLPVKRGFENSGLCSIM